MRSGWPTEARGPWMRRGGAGAGRGWGRKRWERPLGAGLLGAGSPQHLAGRAGWKAPFAMGAGPQEAGLGCGGRAQEVGWDGAGGGGALTEWEEPVLIGGNVSGGGAREGRGREGTCVVGDPGLGC